MTSISVSSSVAIGGLPEVGGADDGGARDLGERAGAQQPAAVPERHAVGDEGDGVAVVLEDEERAVLDRVDRVGEAVALAARHARRRLVEDDDGWLLQQDHLQLEPLAPAVAELGAGGVAELSQLRLEVGE